MKLLYHGFLWAGSTARQRFEAFGRQPGIRAIPLDIGAERLLASSLAARVRWKLRWPIDQLQENERLIAAVTAERPDVVFVDNSRVVNRSTLHMLRRICDPILVYYSPDDMIAPHNLSWPVRFTFPEWDVFFTTKAVNVAELAARGVRNPVLVGNAFDPELHRPMSRDEVGEDFERFDLVFTGTFEDDRFRSLARLAEAGFSIAIYGNRASRLGGSWGKLKSDRIRVGPPGYGLDYAGVLHHGKVALCFLRKMNRDVITTRSIEIPAMRRPMVAERTPEHDAHFAEGSEYLGFRNDTELIEACRRLLGDGSLRDSLAQAGYARCFASGYDTSHRGRTMAAAIADAAVARYPVRATAG